MVQIHVVQRGENLGQLSMRYGVTVNQIAAVNALPNPNVLIVGQALLIPDPHREYVVQQGDSLGIIAQRYGIPVQDLLQANEIRNPSLIYQGQVLLIPFLYTIKPGETLWAIARKFRVTVQEILHLNRMSDPSLIHPGQVLRIPGKSRRTIEVNAFTGQFTEAGAQEVQYLSHDLTYISPFAYRLHGDGSLENINDVPLIRAAVPNQVVPMMAVTNFSATEAGSNVAHLILNSTELQDRVLNNILNIMRNKGYHGLNIDFENVLPVDREMYNQFLRRTVSRLHAEHFFVSSSLAPKHSAEQHGLLYEAHDYPAHGEILDFVVLMTYEWGYRLGPPQAISPINEIRAVLDYAVKVIPRNKIFMGFQLYARDWLLPHVQGQEAETFSMQEAIRRAVQHGAVIQYDQKSQSPFYRYTDDRGRSHEVWFEDARSAQVKFDTVKDYNLRGISYWELGYPFPQNWVLLEDNFRVRKM
jgi:spore germination protein